jgi:uncharacterized protein
MSQYLSPGVYVEEVPPTARPIAGVGTSTASFIGFVPDGVVMPNQPGKFQVDANNVPRLDDTTQQPLPLPFSLADAGHPTLITSWENFKNAFGDFQVPPQGLTETDPGYIAYRQLQHAVYGFFNNGGTRCWVIRSATLTDLDAPSDLLNTLAAIDEIAIVAMPGATKQAQHDALLSHCLNLKDRVAVLDGVEAPGRLTAEAIAPVGASEAGSYGALYFPWVKVMDPMIKDKLTVPPSGHIAGIYARSDANRGVFKAPANEVILGALDVERRLSKADQDGLNPEGINVIRVFNDTIKVWGARTRADESHSEFRYISTRRFMNFLRESIDQGTQFVVFEPNSPALWQRITRSVGDFLLTQWQNGALFGETPKQAFFVKCDAETNPPNVRELGQVVTEIGVAIVKPAEFVIFRIQQTTGS